MCGHVRSSGVGYIATVGLPAQIDFRKDFTSYSPARRLIHKFALLQNIWLVEACIWRDNADSLADVSEFSFCLDNLELTQLSQRSGIGQKGMGQRRQSQP